MVLHLLGLLLGFLVVVVVLVGVLVDVVDDGDTAAAAELDSDGGGAVEGRATLSTSNVNKHTSRKSQQQSFDWTQALSQKHPSDCPPHL